MSIAQYSKVEMMMIEFIIISYSIVIKVEEIEYSDISDSSSRRNNNSRYGNNDV